MFLPGTAIEFIVVGNPRIGSITLPKHGSLTNGEMAALLEISSQSGDKPLFVYHLDVAKMLFAKRGIELSPEQWEQLSVPLLAAIYDFVLSESRQWQEPTTPSTEGDSDPKPPTGNDSI